MQEIRVREVQGRNLQCGCDVLVGSSEGAGVGDERTGVTAGSRAREDQRVKRDFNY